jgi:uncharacterized lipoprotein YmbA
MRVLVVGFLLVLLGCSSTQPERQSYLLRPDVPAGTVSQGGAQVVSLGPIVVAEYLVQRGIVMETEPGEIAAARYHEWAEPLADSLGYLLEADLSTALRLPVVRDQPEWVLRVDIRIDELHGTSTGEAKLVARWTLTQPDGVQLGYQYSTSEAIARDGYGGLVEAERETLRALAGEIARTARELLGDDRKM